MRNTFKLIQIIAQNRILHVSQSGLLVLGRRGSARVFIARKVDVHLT